MLMKCHGYWLYHTCLHYHGLLLNLVQSEVCNDHQFLYVPDGMESKERVVCIELLLTTIKMAKQTDRTL
jgi:hypothetical protein